MKIMVIGGGGVGGYITAYLDKYCPGEVTLVERGEHKEYLEAHGLSVYSEALGDRHVEVPVLGQAADAGVQDVIFICVKADALGEALRNIKPAVDEHTILVPLMNGAEHERWIRRVLDKGIVVDTALYINSEVASDYSIHQRGHVVRIYVGSEDPAALEEIHDLLNHPGMRAYQAVDIRLETWEKYVFNFAYNLITAYYGMTLGEVLAQEGSHTIIQRLLEEVCSVADAMGVILPNRIGEAQYNRICTKEDKTVSSSLARDIAMGREGELDMFSGFLIRMGKRYHVPVPMTEKVDQVIRERLTAVQKEKK
ncbi:MAG: 2-dehydropantoate 2-reductase [Acidaminococcus sp.]|jgi:2-dehydropantoate 2-reductase|nr:2-dehydropantoate 2-reductase [Acidaminococcus sp.]MCI2100335.1 2-dehydropantoate 2-reductase [Acidaminococcus sp.]MCI2114656.1 2-dehydropantoate 2-reductase [Acidaminococcus sp.]MCI2116692.1 2-dehydropantoate 2-reductase [Acidaminococcus sp.]